MENCIFCKIIKQEIQAHKIYEDEETIVILDINPASKGHSLVIPKKHYENLQDVTEEALKNIIVTTKKIAKKLQEKLNATGINVVNASGKDAQQTVEHIHFHVVPRYKEDGLDLWFHGRKKELNVDEIKKQIIN
ncbi:HIT family protein [Candidatus Woesearchaeota archaeon]|nr:HIT family protein [Candidatus Woesearchaeota archaeon]